MNTPKQYMYDDLAPHAPRKSGGTFDYDGLTWTVFAHPIRSNSGKTIVDWSVRYTSSQGHIVDKDEAPRNRRNDPDRNWGLGRD